MMHVCLLTSHIRRSSSLRYCWKKEREIAGKGKPYQGRPSENGDGLLYAGEGEGARAHFDA